MSKLLAFACWGCLCQSRLSPDPQDALRDRALRRCPLVRPVHNGGGRPRQETGRETEGADATKARRQERAGRSAGKRERRQARQLTKRAASPQSVDDVRKQPQSQKKDRLPPRCPYIREHQGEKRSFVRAAFVGALCSFRPGAARIDTRHPKSPLDLVIKKQEPCQIGKTPAPKGRSDSTSRETPPPACTLSKAMRQLPARQAEAAQAGRDISDISASLPALEVFAFSRVVIAEPVASFRSDTLDFFSASDFSENRVPLFGSMP